MATRKLTPPFAFTMREKQWPLRIGTGESEIRCETDGAFQITAIGCEAAKAPSSRESDHETDSALTSDPALAMLFSVRRARRRHASWFCAGLSA
jgi:hypothetical protein